jgi:hypothetical protein
MVLILESSALFVKTGSRVREKVDLSGDAG